MALKVLDPDLADDEIARQRFCREARAAASITHENVVAVHQVERASDDGLPYLVMQLVAGESLEQRLDRVKQLPLREIVRIGMQAAHGLAAAHAQGLIHRDIKPGNILLEQPSDRVKLTDFGLARVADDVKLTGTGFVSGTPLYMAPEQALGGEADPRSDLFSLGAVLYEMCAGQPPFAGNSAPVILKQIVEARQRPLKELNPSVPAWLATTIDRLLAKKPADRIQSADHLAELFEYEWALMKTSSEDVPTVCQEEQRRRVRRNRLIAAAVGATFLVVGLLGGMFLAPRGGLTTATTAVSTAEPLAVLTANAGAVWSVAFDPTSDTVAMAVEDGSVRLWDLSTKSVKTTLDAHRGAVWSAQILTPRRPAGDGRRRRVDQTLESRPGRAGEELSSIPTPCADWHSRATTKPYMPAIGAARCASGRSRAIKHWPKPGNPGPSMRSRISPDDETLATAGTDKVSAIVERQDPHAEAAFGRTCRTDQRFVVRSRRRAIGLGRLGQNRSHLGREQRPAC